MKEKANRKENIFFKKWTSQGQNIQLFGLWEREQKAEDGREKPERNNLRKLPSIESYEFLGW